MLPVLGEPLGFEIVLADQGTAHYGMLGRIDELDGHMRATPNLSSTYMSPGNRARVVKRRIVQNVSGGSLTKGMVVIHDPTGGSYVWGVDTTTTANVPVESISGVVFGDCITDGTESSPASIADDSIFDVGISGIFYVRCISTVAAGDGLATSTTAGVADTSTTKGAIFGYALTAAADGGSSAYYCYARVNGIPE